jgi:3-oxoacyl-[acyl-carrier-protein] synthase-3
VKKIYSRISGIGAYTPERVLTNKDIEKIVDTTHEWITTRTGIHERRIAAPQQTTSDLALHAAMAAIADAAIDPKTIDLILVATASPDMLFPSTACMLQGKLGLAPAPAFDISAACSGFLYGLQIAHQFIANGTSKNVLLVSAEKLSAITNWKDRTTCVLFGDGAGAILLSATNEPIGVRDVLLRADGSYHEILRVPAGGSAMPLTQEVLASNLQYIQMSGKEVFKLAVKAMQDIVVEILEKNNLRPSDIACVIPHQANTRIIEALADRLELPMDRFFLNLHKYGNMSAASIPVAFAEARAEGRIKPGDKILFAAFGGGLTWASAIVDL